MNKISEKSISDDPLVLTRAWQNDASFLLIPEKASINSTWLEQSVQTLPDELRTWHYGLLTSGSSGHPKLIIGSRSRSEKLVQTLHQIQESEEVENTILALPLTYSFAFVNQWLWSHIYKRNLVYSQGLSDPQVFCQNLKASHNAKICLVGSMVPVLLKLFANLSFPGIIRLHFAGGRFPQEYIPSLIQMFPNAKIFNNYGCAEALPRLTVRAAEASLEAANIGRPLPGVELASFDENKLFFRSIYGAVAYIDESGFHKIESKDWVPTGDVGQECGDGSWMLLGRTNEVFKRHGEKVSLMTLTQTVRPLWKGDLAFYREVDPMGEEGHVLVLSPTTKNEDILPILKAFRQNHSRSSWPLRIECAEALPLLPNGKFDIQALSQQKEKSILWYQRI